MHKLIDELAYVIIETNAIEEWARFSQDILGAVVNHDGRFLLAKLDARPFRYLIRPSEENHPPVLGWQTADALSLENAVERLAKLGLAADALNEEECRRRRITDGVRFTCHNAIRHEVVYGAVTEQAFDPPGDVTGYVTGSGGMGHTVWAIPDVNRMDQLMIDTFGMSLREDIPTPLGAGHFYGCNPRHHSLAAFSAETLRFEHVMAEMRDSDDVGCAMDRVADSGYELIQPLGRHRTDHMMSFYVRTPSGFGMELGCEGVLCGEDWAEVRDASRRRPWGHGDMMRAHHKAQKT